MTREEAIKAIKAWDFLDNDEKEVIETLIPELKESEDEEIRQAMINFFKSERIKDGIAVLHFGVNIEKMIAWLEKQGNPADKIEPKFKNGQWIVFNGLTLYVNEVVQGYYRTTSIGGIPNSYDWNIDNAARLWTIQEAKDGDVLEFGDHGRLVTGILSFVNKTTGKVDVSCLLEGDKFKVGVFYNLDTVKPHPVTKEKSDLLFQKIREAGYVWDPEKKELRKMEQKPKWSEEDEENFQHCLMAIKHSELHTADDIVEMYKWLQSLKQRIKEL